MKSMRLITKAALGTLARVAVGQEATIVGFDANAAAMRRYQELGLRPGQRVLVMQATAGGGRVVKVATSRYALSADALRQVKVAV